MSLTVILYQLNLRGSPNSGAKWLTTYDFSSLIEFPNFYLLFLCFGQCFTLYSVCRWWLCIYWHLRCYYRLHSALLFNLAIMTLFQKIFSSQSQAFLQVQKYFSQWFSGADLIQRWKTVGRKSVQITLIQKITDSHHNISYLDIC